MKIEANELIGHALDWAVAKCEFGDDMPAGFASRSTDWAYGGPIIEREEIFLAKSLRGCWTGTIYSAPEGAERIENMTCYSEDGPTPLVAAMRCYVAKHLGDTVDVPDSVLNLVE